jgi:3-hydroxybutyryl-CoA dehydratase
MAIEKARRCMSINDFKLGDKFEKDYSVSYEMVKKFAEISGDWNPAHHDAEYAATTVFKQQIAHGMISVAQFSGIFGMDMPGLGAIWLNQSANFMAPVYLDQPYKAVVEVIEISVETNTVTFSTACFDAEGKKVLQGQGALKPIPQKVKDKMTLDLA